MHIKKVLRISEAGFLVAAIFAYVSKNDRKRWQQGFARERKNPLQIRKKQMIQPFFGMFVFFAVFFF